MIRINLHPNKLVTLLNISSMADHYMAAKPHGLTLQPGLEVVIPLNQVIGIPRLVKHIQEGVVISYFTGPGDKKMPSDSNFPILVHVPTTSTPFMVIEEPNHIKAGLSFTVLAT
jgi:hypothetical protein